MSPLPPSRPPPRAPLSHLEDATLRFVLAHASENGGWLDLTRVCSQTGRMLPDVRQAVARLVRRGHLATDGSAANTERWVRFVLPGAASAPATPPVAPTPAP
jgi:hypothetical protein